ncbi:MAG: SprT-like domain-containing protein [Christensenellales bacterium]
MKKICTDPNALTIFEEVKVRAQELYPHYFVDSSFTLYVTDSMKRLGFCITKRLVNYHPTQLTTNRPKRYIVEIMISKYILDTPLLRSTIVHEMGHAVTNNSLHDQKWQTRGNKIGEKWGITVREFVSQEEYRLVAINFPKPKYVIMCQNCDVTAYRHRRSKLIDHPELYRCPKCGGDIKVSFNDNQ